MVFSSTRIPCDFLLLRVYSSITDQLYRVTVITGKVQIPYQQTGQSSRISNCITPRCGWLGVIAFAAMRQLADCPARDNFLTIRPADLWPSSRLWKVNASSNNRIAATTTHIIGAYFCPLPGRSPSVE